MEGNLQRAQGGTFDAGEDTWRDARGRGWDGAGRGVARVLSVGRAGEESGKSDRLDQHYRERGRGSVGKVGGVVRPWEEEGGLKSAGIYTNAKKLPGSGTRVERMSRIIDTCRLFPRAANYLHLGS